MVAATGVLVLVTVDVDGVATSRQAEETTLHAYAFKAGGSFRMLHARFSRSAPSMGSGPAVRFACSGGVVGVYCVCVSVVVTVVYSVLVLVSVTWTGGRVTDGVAPATVVVDVTSLRESIEEQKGVAFSFLRIVAAADTMRALCFGSP